MQIHDMHTRVELSGWATAPPAAIKRFELFKYFERIEAVIPFQGALIRLWFYLSDGFLTKPQYQYSKELVLILQELYCKSTKYSDDKPAYGYIFFLPRVNAGGIQKYVFS